MEGAPNVRCDNVRVYITHINILEDVLAMLAPHIQSRWRYKHHVTYANASKTVVEI
jgi:hypothetical protein